MPKSKSKSDDCNCYYTGFHPRFGVLPKKKTEETSTSAQVNPTWNRSNTAASTAQTRAKTTKPSATGGTQAKTPAQAKSKSRKTAK